MTILKILFISIFLLAAAEPVLFALRRIRELWGRYTTTEDDREKKVLGGKVRLYVLVFLAMFAIYCFLVYNLN